MQMYHQLSPFNKAILRTPYLSLEELDKILEDDVVFVEFINQDYFLEALLIASPNVYSQLKKIINKPLSEWDRKFYLTIVKYIVRMATRATPFGLFSRYSILPINQTKDFHKIIVSNNKSIRFHLLDGELRNRVNSEIKKNLHQLTYIINPSIYCVKNEIRFLKKSDNESSSIIIIERVKSNKFLEELINAKEEKFTYQKLVDLSIKYSPELGDLLIKELISMDFLLPNYGHSLTSYNVINKGIENNALETIQKKLNHFNPSSYLYEYVEFNKKILKEFNYEKTTLNVSLKSEIVLETPLKLNLISDLKKVFLFLSGLNDSNIPKKNIFDFKEEFTKRYNTKKVPLLLALDSDVGIGYSNNKINSLTGNIPRKIKAISPFDKKNKTLDYNKSDELLLDLLINAKQNNLYQVDLSNISVDKNERFYFPPSFSVLLSLVSSADDNDTFIFNYAGGENGNKLHGRLSILDDELIECSKEIANHNTSSNQECIYAEVLFEPNPTLTNVLIRPNLYDYEIPIFSNSIKETKEQIKLSDLSLFIKNDRLVLWSETYEKEIIPCLSCAHNYQQNYNLPIYEFLCDMEFQNHAPFLFFTWGKFARYFNFLPRATYKNIILSPAKWNFITTEIKDIFKNEENLDLWKKKHNIPSRFFLSNNENEMFISLDNKLQKEIFLNEIKKVDSFQIREFITDENNPIVSNNSGQSLLNELIVNFKNDSVKNISKMLFNDFLSNGKITGEDWVYVKIYVGIEYADIILKELLEKIKKEVYQKWFFIRYWDSDFHLRIRFKSDNNNAIIYDEINKQLSPYIDDNLVWKIQFENYQPEIERYTSIALNEVEKLFYFDSELYLNIINNLHGFPDEKFKIKLALQNIYYLVDDFELTEKEKHNMYLLLKNELFKYQNITSKINSELKHEKSFVQEYLNETISNNFNDTDSISINTECCLRSFKNKEVIKVIFEKIGREKTIDILRSIIHMNLNRCFSLNQNLYEAFIYDQFELFYRRKLKFSHLNK